MGQGGNGTADSVSGRRTSPATQRTCWRFWRHITNNSEIVPLPRRRQQESLFHFGFSNLLILVRFRAVSLLYETRDPRVGCASFSHCAALGWSPFGHGSDGHEV